MFFKSLSFSIPARDFLQRWNQIKRLQRDYKGFVYGTIAIKDGKFPTIWRLTVEPQKEETPDLSAFTPVADNVIRRSGRHFSRLIETCAVHQILNVHFTLRYPPLCQIYSSTEIRTSLFNVRCAKYTGRWSTLMGTIHTPSIIFPLTDSFEF